MTVNQGTTDVDSPTASAVGGTINLITRTPSHTFGGQAGLAFGSDNFQRYAVMLDTGDLDPSGTRAFAEGSFQKYDKFRGPGDLEKDQVNARIYQPLPTAPGDFLSVAVHYNRNRNNNYRTVSQADVATHGWDYDFDKTCIPAGGISGNCSNYYARLINPSDTGNIRAQSRFTLAHNLHLTVDPYFEYTLADGGTQLATINESDGRVRGAAGWPATT